MAKTNENSLQCAYGYEAPFAEVVGCSIEGVLCESIRQIDNLELLDEQEW